MDDASQNGQSATERANNASGRSSLAQGCARRISGEGERTMNPTALITGGSRGIGRAIAVALAAEKYNCVVNYARNQNAAEEVKGQIESLGSRACLVKADIASSDDRRRLVEESI